MQASDHTDIVLVDLPAGRSQRQAALFICVALLVSAAVAAPFASVPLGHLDAFIPISQTLIFVNDLITSALLIAQFSIVRWRAILVLASGYLFTALVDVTQLLTFPGTFTSTGLFGAGLQTTGWLYEFWHAGFPIAVIAYVVLANQSPEKRVSRRSTRTAVATSVALVMASVVVLSWLATAGDQYLPKLFLDRGTQAPAAQYFSGLVLLLSIAALLMLWLRQRSVLDLWLIVAMCAWSLDIVIQTLAGGRWTLGFYLSRIYALITATVVLTVLLGETMTLYARLAVSVFAERRERESRIMTLEALRIERQLRQDQRLEALGRLAGGIAHDFNNLLGAILGYGEMALRNARVGSRLRRNIENIMIAGERGRALVERILAFSRSGVGEQVAVHVEGVVRETLALFVAKLPQNIVIERRLHASSAAVMGDPTQIHQVLMNLLANAVQAMPSGGTLRVSLDRTDLQEPRLVTTGSIAAREYVVMNVADSGSGIPAEILEKIFDPFFTTKEVGVGTGLGLSLVHGIVTGLGGAIDVETTVGKGSEFKVYLPLAGEVTMPGRPRTPIKRWTQHKGQGRVLIVDDEEALVKLATETLTELGYSAVGLTSSAKALETFQQHPEQFDAVITDESMPGTSGSELIRKMRMVRPTLPMLLVSGYLSSAVVERAREAGASEVLTKPFSAHQLETALERAFFPARR